MAKGQLVTKIKLSDTQIQITLDSEQRKILDRIAKKTKQERVDVAKHFLIAQIEDEGYPTRTEKETLKSFEKIKGLGKIKAAKARTLILIRLSRIGEFCNGCKT